MITSDIVITFMVCVDKDSVHMSKDAIASNIDLVSPLAMAKLIRQEVAEDVKSFVICEVELLLELGASVSTYLDKFSNASKRESVK